MLLIQNAHIKTMAGADIPNGCLLVEDGKIAAVAPEIDAPAGAKVIDAQGRLLTPGCVEAHCHRSCARSTRSIRRMRRSVWRCAAA